MYKIGETVKIRITDYAAEGFGLKTACRRARDEAFEIFGGNLDGHLTNVENNDRSSCSIIVTFVTVKMRGGMFGWETMYEFSARAENDNGIQCD